MKLIKSKKGQGLIEYLIIVALIGVATISVVKLLAHSTNYKLGQVINAIQGNTSTKNIGTPSSINSSMVKKKDFSNFARGASNNKSKSVRDETD